jgi:hypothetical protein
MMKQSNKFKLFIAAAALIGTSASAQLIDEKDVSITLDLQPVLQLEMTTPDQIQFIFDDINEYQAGITQYAATILKVSSTVSWDLYAVGRSQGNSGDGFWDQQIDYGSSNNVNAVGELPLSLLEIRQNTPNSAIPIIAIPDATDQLLDYSNPFQNDRVFLNNGADPLENSNLLGIQAYQNNIYVNSAGTPPGPTGKYIAGHSGTTGVNDFMPGGTYLNQTGTTSDYYYTIDYRILPGLPATFPMAYDHTLAAAQDIATVNGASSYAEPGVYTMYVQYILLEDQ